MKKISIVILTLLTISSLYADKYSFEMKSEDYTNEEQELIEGPTLAFVPEQGDTHYVDGIISNGFCDAENVRACSVSKWDEDGLGHNFNVLDHNGSPDHVDERDFQIDFYLNSRSHNLILKKSIELRLKDYLGYDDNDIYYERIALFDANSDPTLLKDKSTMWIKGTLTVRDNHSTIQRCKVIIQSYDNKIITTFHPWRIYFEKSAHSTQQDDDSSSIYCGDFKMNLSLGIYNSASNRIFVRKPDNT